MDTHMQKKFFNPYFVLYIKINELDFIKIKNFCSSNGIMDWNKIFANNICDKGLVCTIY